MDLLLRLKHALDRDAHERAIIRDLSRLGERELADLGLRRSDIGTLARRAVRNGRLDVFTFDPERREPASATADSGQAAGYLAGNALAWRAA